MTSSGRGWGLQKLVVSGVGYPTQKWEERHMGPGLTQERGQVWELRDADGLEEASPAARVPTSSRYPEGAFESASAAVLLTVCVMLQPLSPQPRENAFVHSRSSYFFR